MRSPDSFVAVEGTESSIEFRKLLVAWFKVQPDVFVAFQRALELALALSEPTRSNAVVNVIADVLEAHTVEMCARLFDEVERIGEAVVTITRADTTCGGLLLKTLIHQFRGAGAIVHAVYRGRLLMFLSRMMPTLHASGINKEGLIAPASFVITANAAAGLADDNLVQNMDPVSGNCKLDYGLYAMFWRFQQSVSSGTALLMRSPLFDTMVSSCDAVLGAVQACNATAKPARAAEGVASRPLLYFRDAEVLLAHFTPEFDSQGSFKLQVLLQMSLFLSALERQSKIEKQGAVIRELLKRVNTELGRLGASSGAAELVAEDAKWQKWRAENTKLDALPAAVELPALPSLAPPNREEILQRKKNTGFGDPELTRLWALRGSGKEPKVIEPTFAEFVERVLEEADPANDIEEQYQVRQKPVFQWKMMRAGLKNIVALQHGSSFKSDLLTMAQSVAKAASEREKGGKRGREEDEQNAGEAETTGEKRLREDQVVEQNQQADAHEEEEEEEDGENKKRSLEGGVELNEDTSKKLRADNDEKEVTAVAVVEGEEKPSQGEDEVEEVVIML